MILFNRQVKTHVKMNALALSTSKATKFSLTSNYFLNKSKYHLLQTKTKLKIIKQFQGLHKQILAQIIY